jgi:hypothetical protein
MEEEHKRQNHRIEEIEETQKGNHKLLVAIEKLAMNMEIMQKEQKEQGERLEALENRDGETWRKVKWHILTVTLGAIIGFLIKTVGI